MKHLTQHGTLVVMSGLVLQKLMYVTSGKFCAFVLQQKINKLLSVTAPFRKQTACASWREILS